jgi:hypothetical protein
MTITNLLLGTIFGFLGCLTAFLITYDEYQHHLDKKNALKASIETGVFTFFIFLGISLLVGLIFSNVKF